ncbi:Elongation factor 1-beta [Candidatus Bilamarchaeum dharawalense]|uniref:Elongation factor 1-beta n=1 Tax=Candidatus Bilamarchaeum dharawalense TaxID=2885759 RepID=A0A5E4LTR2_9ARCH|nr:Elongation factor 1-beta [Candidatus Bilamarchaeum dharawalense]
MSDEYNVAAQVKIYVDDPASLPSVKAGIEKVTKVQKFWEEDLGFGIKVLKANLLLKDSEGGMDKIEQNIREVKGVSEFEVESVTRLV